MEKKTSLFDNGLIWFGAGVSLAEILTGTYFSTLGFGRGLAAILLGHVIGCVLLFPGYLALRSLPVGIILPLMFQWHLH